jgi:hypothetical protein
LCPGEGVGAKAFSVRGGVSGNQPLVAKNMPVINEVTSSDESNGPSSPAVRVPDTFRAHDQRPMQQPPMGTTATPTVGQARHRPA